MGIPCCPRCRCPLHRGVTRDHELWACPNCGGVWLDNATCQRIVSTFDGELVAVADNAASQSRASPDVSKTAPCPECASPMRTNRFQQANVVVDVCDRHGTWFDRNELQQVSSALHARRAPAVASSAAMVAVAAPNASAVADVAGGVACVAVEVAAEAATSTVAEGIADFAIGIVGGIFESIFD